MKGPTGFMLCEATGDSATIVAASGDHKNAAQRLAGAVHRVAGERPNVTTNLMMAFFSGAKRFVLLATPAEVLKIAAFIREDASRRRIEALATTPLGKDAFGFQTIEVKDFRVLMAVGMTAREVDFAATEIATTMTLDEYEDLAVATPESTIRPRVSVRGLALSDKSAGCLGPDDLRALRLTHIVAPPGALIEEAKAAGLKSYLRAGGDSDLSAAQGLDGIAVLPGEEATPQDIEQSLAAFAADNPGIEILLPADETFDALAERAETEFFFDCRRLADAGDARERAWRLLSQTDPGALVGALLRSDAGAFIAVCEECLSPVDLIALQVVPWRSAGAADALAGAVVHRTDAPGRDEAARLFAAAADADPDAFKRAAGGLREATSSSPEECPEELFEVLRWSAGVGLCA